MSWHLDGCRREGDGSGLPRARRSGPRSAHARYGARSSGSSAWEQSGNHGCSSVRSAALVCSLVRGLQLRKHGSSLVAGIGMHSWGSRGRRFKSGRPDTGQKADSKFRVGLLGVLGPRSNVWARSWLFLTDGQVPNQRRVAPQHCGGDRRDGTAHKRHAPPAFIWGRFLTWAPTCTALEAQRGGPGVHACQSAYGPNRARGRCVRVVTVCWPPLTRPRRGRSVRACPPPGGFGGTSS